MGVQITKGYYLKRERVDFRESNRSYIMGLNAASVIFGFG